MLTPSFQLPINPVPNLAAGVAPAGAAPNAGAQPGGFARELSRHTENRPASTPPKNGNEAAARKGEGPNSAKPAEARDRKAERSADKNASKSSSGEDDSVKDAANTSNDAADESAASEPGAGAPSDITAMMAMMQRAGATPTQDNPAAPGKDGSLGSEELPLEAADQARVRGGGPDLRGVGRAPGLRNEDAAALAGADRQRGVGSESFDSLMSAKHEAHALHEQAINEKAVIDNAGGAERLGEPMPPVAAPVTATTSATRAAGTVPTAMIPAHTYSGEFAPALAAQVSVFAREGVHEAKLQLNPAETGPIVVRIAIEAAQAHVDFVAENAQTRSAIEASLPDLAASLREAGFTLAGGGVFQQSGERRGDARQSGSDHRDDSGASRSSSVASGDVPAAAQVQQRIVRQGGVDLYA